MPDAHLAPQVEGIWGKSLPIPPCWAVGWARRVWILPKLCFPLPGFATTSSFPIFLVLHVQILAKIPSTLLSRVWKMWNCGWEWQLWALSSGSGSLERRIPFPAVPPGPFSLFGVSTEHQEILSPQSFMSHPLTGILWLWKSWLPLNWSTEKCGDFHHSCKQLRWATDSFPELAPSPFW